MKQIEALIDSFSGKYQSKLAQITSPLQNHFGIEYFCYQKITDNGEWHLLGNNADWLHFSADHQLYLHDPTLVHPKDANNGSFFPDLSNSIEIKESFVEKAREHFNLQHAMVSIHKYASYVEYYVYATSCDNIKVYHHYVNNLDLLARIYPEYFKQKLGNIINRMDDQHLDLRALPNSPFLRNNLPLIDCEQNVKCFVDEMTGHDLTERELACIELYAQGLTAKQSAQKLDISYRTVEGHLHHAKNKLNLDYKHQLLNHPIVNLYK